MTYVSCTVVKFLKKLNSAKTNFENICDWFFENKVSIHFPEDETKSILFVSIKSKVKEN